MDLLLTLARVLILGVSYGLILFLIATGMSLTLGLMRVVNMSHGAIYMFSGYVAVWSYGQFKSWILSIVIGTVVGALLGALLEIGFLRRLYKVPTYQVLLTIGIINILNNVAQWIWGGLPLTTPTPAFLRGGPMIGEMRIPWMRFFIIGVGLILAVILWFVQDKTRIGAMVRAGMDNREIAASVGINNRLVFTGVFILGSAVAGFSAMMGGAQTGLSATTAWDVLLNSIIVVVVGGTGSIQGALLGGIIIGVANAFGTVFMPTVTPFLIYLVLIIVLLIKPSGLMGRKVDVNKAIEADLEKTGAKGKGDPMPKSEVVIRNGRLTAAMHAYRWVPSLLVVAILAVCPMFMGDFLTTMVSKALVFAVFAMSQDVIMGYGGMRSFGHAAYFGTAAYMVGLLYKYFEFNNFWLNIVFAVILCGILAAIISYFTLKFSGTYFLIVTMAFGPLLSVTAKQLSGITGGTDGLSGIPRPNLGWEINWNSTKLFYLMLISTVVCYLLLRRIMTSSFGRTIVGVRENEGRMKALGYNTWATKYAACIVAGIFAGIAGVLYVYLYQIVTPSNVDLTQSAMPMLMVIMGGGGTLWGPAIGSFIINLFQTYAGIWMPERWPLLLGLLYVVVVLFLRGGISPYLIRLYHFVGNKLFPEGKGAIVVKAEAAGKEAE